MDTVSSNIIINDFNKEKEKAMKKTEEAKTKERIEVVCDLVDAHLDEKLTKDELIDKLMEVVGKPIIKVGCFEYVVSEWEGGLYLECRTIEKNGCKDNWCQVEDLNDWTIYEYNELVDKLHKHYPDYPIERLDGRFV